MRLGVRSARVMLQFAAWWVGSGSPSSLAPGPHLAELADLHRNYVGGVGRGERNIALLNIVALARVLRVRPSKLIEVIS